MQRLNERSDDQAAALGALIGDAMAGMWTAMPAIVQSFNADAVTVSAQPAIQGVTTDEAGNQTAVNLPLLVDVPVYFPRGGGCTLTFPVKSGDECLIVFASRCIDTWWQSGGVQPPMFSRTHSLADGFAFVGVQSQANKISNISTSAVQLRSDDGQAYAEIDPSSHKVTVKTTGDVSTQAGGFVESRGGGLASAKGVVQGDCICPITGKPHIMISQYVKASL